MVVLKVSINWFIVYSESVQNYDVKARVAQLHEIFNTRRLTLEGIENSVTEHTIKGKLKDVHNRPVILQSRMNDIGFLPEPAEYDEFIDNYVHSDRFFSN